MKVILFPKPPRSGVVFKKKEIVILRISTTFPRLMPKAIARRKTKKSVSKRFKVTGTGKILRAKASRRHLLASKSAKRKRHLAKGTLVDVTDMARIKENLPFH